MQQLVLIPHHLESTIIHQRAIDDYVNVTPMCKAVGKQFNDYTRLGPTKEFLEALSGVIGNASRTNPGVDSAAGGLAASSLPQGCP